MSHVVAFTVSQKSKNLYRLPIASTLLHFVSYDFSYFIQQCTQLTHTCMQTGSFDPVTMYAPKEYIRRCHPYFQILVHDDFEQITLDFAIDYICRTNKIGLEELWAHNISAEKPFWQSVFKRISAYKTGCAINQWDNLLRMQQYATEKLAFIYDGTPVTMRVYRTRKEYYDLAFTVLAEEMGYHEADLPKIYSYSPAQLPGASAILGKLSAEMERSVRPLAREHRTKPAFSHINNTLQDQCSGLIINSMMHLSRPGPMETRAAVETCTSMPDKVYMPSSFKALIDLEFNEIIENNMIFRRSSKDGEFEIIEPVNSKSNAAAPSFDDESAVFSETEKLFETNFTSASEPLVAATQPSAESDTQSKSEPSLTTPTKSKDAKPISQPVEKSKDTSTPNNDESVQASPTLQFEPTPLPTLKAKDTQTFTEPSVPEPDTKPFPKSYAKPQQQAVCKLMHSKFTNLQNVAESTNNPDFTVSPKYIGDDLNVRCQLVQSALRNAIGRQENATEFDEWSRSLMQLRIRIVRKELSLDYLERFLSATEKIYQLNTPST